MKRSVLSGLVIADGRRSRRGAVQCAGDQSSSAKSARASRAKKANDVRDLPMTDKEEQELGARSASGFAPATAWCRTRPSTATWRSSAPRWRRAAPPGAALDVHRARHRRRQRLCRARRLRAHHPRRARADKNEAELAGVLGHEIIHVTEKHTIRAIQKSKAVQMGAAETLSGSSSLMERAVTATYDNIVERGFGRAEENESDEEGVALANKIGYAPNGLTGFLTTLKDRNKESKEKRGLFASHPEMQERLDRITKQIAPRSWRRPRRSQPRSRRTSATSRCRSPRCPWIRAPPGWRAVAPRPTEEEPRREEDRGAEEEGALA